MSDEDSGAEAIVVLPYDNARDARAGAAMLAGEGWGAIAITNPIIVAAVREWVRQATRAGRQL